MPFEETLIRELESFGRVLSIEMTDGSPVFAYRRDKEVELLQKHLDRARQKSLLLVSPSGCGKSAILQQLIHHVSVRRNKPSLVLETSTSPMMKGTRYLGVGVYGLLRREQGLHEFVSGKSSDTVRRTAFAKVQVMPIVEDADSDHDHVNVAAKKARGEALRCSRFRVEVTATDKSSGVQISIRNALDLEEARTIAQDLLRAECRRQQDHAHGAAPADADSVIRRYTLRPRQSAKDLRSGLIQHNLRNLWKGALDEFLLAVLEETQSA